MPIEISWYLQDRIVLVTFIGNVTIDDIKAICVQYIELVDAAPGQGLIHAFHDGKQLDTLPKSVQDTVTASRSAFHHPRSGWTIGYNAYKPAVRFMGNMATRILGVRYRIVDTQADAIKFLKMVDPSLPTVAENQQKNA